MSDYEDPHIEVEKVTTLRVKIVRPLPSFQSKPKQPSGTPERNDRGHRRHHKHHGNR
jgi:hypothetical protein